MSQDPAHNWQAADGGKRDCSKTAGFKDPHHERLSFDGCGINGRDEYRTRIATFADKRGPIAMEYGPLFEAAPEMKTALEKIAGDGPVDELDGETVDQWLDRANPEGLREHIDFLRETARAALAKASKSI